MHLLRAVMAERRSALIARYFGVNPSTPPCTKVWFLFLQTMKAMLHGTKLVKPQNRLMLGCLAVLEQRVGPGQAMWIETREKQTAVHPAGPAALFVLHSVLKPKFRLSNPWVCPATISQAWSECGSGEGLWEQWAGSDTGLTRVWCSESLASACPSLVRV